MDERDEMYDAVDDDFTDAKRDPHRVKKVAYPPRLMVDFTSLGVEALKRYAQFYNVAVREELEKDELAALVARHFDKTLEVDEDDSIVSFIQRIRNGERNATKRSLADKDRKAANDKKRKKSNSRKRQREQSAAPANGAGSGSSGAAASARDAGDDRKASAGGSGAGGSGAASGSLGSGGSSGSGGSGSGSSASASAAAATSGSSSGSGGSSGSSGGGSGSGSSSASSSSSSGGGSKSQKKGGSGSSKKRDKDEDNELYCICNLPSYGNMIACDGKKCPNPSQWYHLECVGFSDGRHPDTWLCPECDPKGFAAFQSKKKKSKQRSKSPASSK